MKAVEIAVAEVNDLAQRDEYVKQLKAHGYAVFITNEDRIGLRLAMPHMFGLPRKSMLHGPIADCANRLHGTETNESHVAIARFNNVLEELITLVLTEPALQQSKESGDLGSHATGRWAAAVLGIVSSPRDIRTVDAWSRQIFVAPGTLKNWCRTAHLSARRSLLLGRLLRVILKRRDPSESLEEFLDVADRRTSERCLRLAGIASGCSHDLPSGAEQFLSTQTLINEAAAIAQLRALLQQRALL